MVEFSEEEKSVLREFGVERPEELLGSLEGGEGEDVWSVLERNAERIVRLGRAGVRRTRRALRARQGGSASGEKRKTVKSEEDVKNVKEEDEEEEGAEATEAEKAEGALTLPSIVTLRYQRQEVLIKGGVFVTHSPHPPSIARLAHRAAPSLRLLRSSAHAPSTISPPLTHPAPRRLEYERSVVRWDAGCGERQGGQAGRASGG